MATQTIRATLEFDIDDGITGRQLRQQLDDVAAFIAADVATTPHVRVVRCELRMPKVPIARKVKP